MTMRVHPRGEDIRTFILKEVEKHPKDIAKFTSEKFDITRQAVSRHLQRLVAEKAIAESGNTRNRSYRLAPLIEWHKKYELESNLQEDVIWRSDVLPVLGHLPENVIHIWHYGFTEMFNNAIDHSAGRIVFVHLKKTAAYAELLIHDDGVGIFRKIQSAMDLLDERHAILELSKGKLTTDPKNHSGQGIFFSSRMFDSFSILSGGVYFGHEIDEKEDWILERPEAKTGTTAWMKLNNHTARSAKKIFDQYSTDDDYGFTKTVVPVALARYENDQLVSRSQAKRVLARVELFKVVVFDFSEIRSIGQAFADEIFRVFATSHPEIELVSIHTCSDVKRMITRAKADIMS
jgi:STAS-like domain of unknown function (DUF4325)